MACYDRCMIAPLLVPYFPSMDGATSIEWHAFLNAATELSVDVDEPNASAFDKWRKVLEDIVPRRFPYLGPYGATMWKERESLWPHSQAAAKAIRKCGEELLERERKRQAAHDALLAYLAKVAPTKTVADLIADAKAAAK